MVIYVTGDTHGANQIGSAPVDGFMPRFNARNFPEQRELTKDDFGIILSTQRDVQRGTSCVKGVSWWSQEQPDARFEAAAVQASEETGWQVDFMFTHDCAISDRCILGYPGGTTRINHFQEEIKVKTEYKHWFFGHFHDNEDLPGHKEHLIYEQIVQID